MKPSKERTFIIVILGLNPVESQRKEIIILKLYLYTKPILMQDGERLNLVISRHNTFKAVSLEQSLKQS